MPLQSVWAKIGSILINWSRKNLFKSWTDSAVSVVFMGLTVWLAAQLLDWAILKSVWVASSHAECQQIVAQTYGDGQNGACWAVLRANFKLIFFGFYPESQYWRPILALLLLFPALAPLFINAIPRKCLWFTAAYPLIAFGLIWGAFGLEPVRPVDLGGFLSTVILAVPSIVIAIIFGVFFALGQQYGLRITKHICTAIIGVFTYVPIPVLLFTITIYAWFFPPGFELSLYGALLFILGMAGAAEIAKTVRQELASITAGQLDAARALGLNNRKVFWQVTLPLAYQRSIPQIAESAALVFQSTSIVVFIGVLNPIGIAFAISGTFEWNSIVWEFFMGIGFIYGCGSFFIRSYAKNYAEKLKREGHFTHEFSI